MSGNNGYVEATKVNLVILCDVDTILGLPYVLFMLELLNSTKLIYTKMYSDPYISSQHMKTFLSS